MLNSIQFNCCAGGGGWGNKLKIFGTCGVCICVCVCYVCVCVCVCLCVDVSVCVYVRGMTSAYMHV